MRFIDKIEETIRLKNALTRDKSPALSPKRSLEQNNSEDQKNDVASSTNKM